MCFSQQPAQQAQAVAAAPAPAEAPPEAATIGAARKAEELDTFGKPVTDNPTRVDRSTVAPAGGAGVSSPTKGSSGINL